MDILATNNEFYNAHADSFDKIPFAEKLIPWMIEYIPHSGCKVLEIGSGAGALAHWLMQRGHDVLCLEPAEKPAARARAKGLNVLPTPLQDFHTDQKYDCILAISSLIHIPRADLPAQIKKMHQFLQPQGFAIVSFLEGTTEGYEDPTCAGKMRFFAKYSSSELEKLLLLDFCIVATEKIEVKKMQQAFQLMVLKPICL